MKAATIIKPDREASGEGKDLLGELNLLLLSAIGYRGLCGATHDIQCAYLRACEEGAQNGMPEFEVKPDNPQGSGDSCNEDDGECSLCNPELQNICSTDELACSLEKSSPFRSVPGLISTIKVYDYTSLVEYAYAKVGNKPFKLKSNKEVTVREEELKELAAIFAENIESFIEMNDVRIDEIPDAFNFKAMSDLVTAFDDYLMKRAVKHNDKELQHYEDGIERSFNRTNFMSQYIEVLKDTANYPIGVLWVDDNSVKKQKRILSSGQVVIERKIQATAERVHPANIWFTSDFGLMNVGRAVFRVKRYTRGDILRWKELGIAGSKKLEKNIDDYLDEYEDGCYIPNIFLFRNLNPIVNYDYDVMIARGNFKKEHVQELGIDIPESMQHEMFVPCEIYFSGSHVLRARVMDVLDEHLGVFTTVFRRNCDSIYGYSVYDFCYPFARLYGNVIDSLDRSVGKSVGMILQVDRSVIEDPDRYFRRDKDGQIVLDISQDQLIEFDSTQAFGAPNFKGFPITVTALPSNIEKLMPVLQMAVDEMERLTKIPNMLTDGTDISSALRTTSNMNMAYNSSAKVVQALLREAENRVLKPGIVYMFDCEVLGQRVPKGLLDMDPEILLSDTLLRESNDAQELLANLQILAQYRDIIPPEKFKTLLNTVARKSLGFREDIVPDAGVFDIERKPQQQTIV